MTFVGLGLKQCKFEQRAIKRHWCTLNRRCQSMRFFNRSRVVYEVVVSELYVWVIERLLINLSVYAKKGGSEWFRLANHLSDCRLQQSLLEGALDFAKHADLPLCRVAASFRRQPDIQLCPRQRKDLLSDFHRNPPPAEQQQISC